MRKILFITPPFHAGVVEVAGRWVPLSLVYLAGAAREAGLSAKIYDAMTKGVGHKEIKAKIREFKPDYVATSAITCTLPDAVKILAPGLAGKVTGKPFERRGNIKKQIRRKCHTFNRRLPHP